jgi:DNA repair exonuclease SbcCD ATPase subunit
VAKKPENALIIHCLEAENIKRLKAVTIRPDGSLIEITGRNGQGKSSLLDAIWWALEGTKHLQAEPIRKGEAKARIKLDMGEVIVERTFTRTGGGATSLKLTDAEGNRFDKPQTILDEMLGKLSLDPLEFERAKPKEQFDMVKALVPGIDFEEIAAADKRDREKRLLVGRDLDREAKAAEAIKVTEEPPQSVSIADLEKEFEKAHEHNQNVTFVLRKLEDDKAESARLRAEITRLAALAAEVEGRIAACQEPPALVDIEGLRSRLAATRALTGAVELYNRRKAHLAKAEELQEIYDAYTAGIEGRELAKQAAIAKAQLPVKGLTIGDGVILLDGLPFEQASDAERLRASVALAMATNPQIKVIRIRDGGRLDPDAREWLAAYAAERGYQVWMERVADAPVGIVIEDGQVAS